jgi:hypothetical protein
MSDPYKIRIGGVLADPYRIAIAYNLDPIIAQAVKKLLRCGRKHKSPAQDVREAITTLQRWEQIRNGPGSGPDPEGVTRPAAGGCSPGRERQEKGNS